MHFLNISMFFYIIVIFLLLGQSIFTLIKWAYNVFSGDYFEFRLCFFGGISLMLVSYFTLYLPDQITEFHSRSSLSELDRNLRNAFSVLAMTTSSNGVNSTGSDSQKSDSPNTDYVSNLTHWEFIYKWMTKTLISVMIWRWDHQFTAFTSIWNIITRFTAGLKRQRSSFLLLSDIMRLRHLRKYVGFTILPIC